jgi:hypothetical protein
MQVRRLKLLYALAGLLWTVGLSAWLLAAHIADSIPVRSGTVYCVLLFASVPAVGYILFFMLFPRATRFLRR